MSMVIHVHEINEPHMAQTSTCLNALETASGVKSGVTGGTVLQHIENMARQYEVEDLSLYIVANDRKTSTPCDVHSRA